jgi:hypothetical protein
MPHPNSIAALIPFRFEKGTSGNPGGKPGKGKIRTYQDFAAEVPPECIDPETGEPSINPDTGKPYTRDDMVMQATFRCAIDLHRNDCTRAQLAWNAYVRGTAKTGDAMEKAAGGMELPGAKVVTYRIPDNGRGPRADDPNVRAPAVGGPMPAVPETDGGDIDGDD